MAKIKIKAGKDAVEKAGESGDFEQPQPGIYIAELTEINEGFSKGEDNKPDKSRPRLECIYKIVGEGRDGSKPEKQYSRLWDYVSFSEAAEWKVAQFGLALGLKMKNGAIDDAIETDADKPGTVIGRTVMIRVKKDSDLEGNYRGKIASLMPVGGGDEDLGDVDEPEFADDVDEDEEEAFGGDDEGDDLLTEEDLDAMENKELASTAKEFDIDPKQFKGKKARANIIAAILEAQAADPDEDDGDDEEPF